MWNTLTRNLLASIILTAMLRPVQVAEPKRPTSDLLSHVELILDVAPCGLTLEPGSNFEVHQRVDAVGHPVGKPYFYGEVSFQAEKIDSPACGRFVIVTEKKGN